MPVSAFVKPVRKNGIRESMLENTETATIAWMDTEIRNSISELKLRVTSISAGISTGIMGTVLSLMESDNDMSRIG